VDGFPRIFGATATFFAIAALIPALLDEPADRPTPTDAAGPRPGLAGWRQSLAADPALVRLAVVAALFSAVLMLFPHYQAFARDGLGCPQSSLLTWVIVQNAATGCASLVAGPLSDRRGTRLVLVGVVALSALTPVLVTLLSIALKMFTNYALELAPRPAEHARYVSLVGAALAAPFAVSPLVGWSVDALGFRPVFLVGACVIAAGAVVAAGLPEPRRR
jgi:MFS family permease